MLIVSLRQPGDSNRGRRNNTYKALDSVPFIFSRRPVIRREGLCFTGSAQHRTAIPDIRNNKITISKQGGDAASASIRLLLQELCVGFQVPDPNSFHYVVGARSTSCHHFFCYELAQVLGSEFSSPLTSMAIKNAKESLRTHTKEQKESTLTPQKSCHKYI